MKKSVKKKKKEIELPRRFNVGSLSYQPSLPMPTKNNKKTKFKKPRVAWSWIIILIILIILVITSAWLITWI